MVIRLIKAFIVSLVAVYVFINGPAIYAQARYWFGVGVEKTDGAGQYAAAIRPVLLPVDASTPVPLPSEAPLIIPKINISVPIVFGIAPEADAIYKNLKNGVVHYSAAPKPGTGGAAIILGHSSLYPWDYNKYGAPFALLGKLGVGDEITVRYADGRTFTYIMKKSLVFNPLEAGNDARLAELEQSARPLVILVTCWPVNSTTNRLAVQAELE